MSGRVSPTDTFIINRQFDRPLSTKNAYFQFFKYFKRKSLKFFQKIQKILIEIKKNPKNYT